MNWLGELIQKEVDSSDSVLDIGCGIMAPLLDTCPAYPKTQLRCKFIIGIDIFRNYLEEIKGKDRVAVINTDIKELSMFLDESLDVVLLLDIVEHLEKDEAQKLILEAERIARKKVIIYTPSYFYDNVEHEKEHFPYCGMGDNPYQGHKSFISSDWLAEHGYTVTFPQPDRNTYGVKSLYQTKRNPLLDFRRDSVLWIDKNTSRIIFSASMFVRRIKTTISRAVYKRSSKL